jgi:S-adenosylmethionine synthetase, C-terminal domain
MGLPGKDSSKVDPGAYFCQCVPRDVVKNGWAKRAQIQIVYAIGRAKPLSVDIGTFGTGDSAAEEEYVPQFDLRPAGDYRATKATTTDLSADHQLRALRATGVTVGRVKQRGSKLFSSTDASGRRKHVVLNEEKDLTRKALPLRLASPAGFRNTSLDHCSAMYARGFTARPVAQASSAWGC